MLVTFSGSMAAGSTTVAASGGTDVAIVQFSPIGASQLVVAAGGPGDDRGEGMIDDGAGGAYIIGSFSGSATFGSTVLSSHGSTDVFVAHVTSAGVYHWAVGFGSPAADAGLAVDFDGANNTLFIGGYAHDNAVFGSTTLPSIGGDTSGFVASLSAADGSVNWVHSYGGACKCAEI